MSDSKTKGKSSFCNKLDDWWWVMFIWAVAFTVGLLSGYHHIALLSK